VTPSPAPHWAVGRRVVLAHRGAAAEAPENTLPAFALAELQGADALEIDVRLTADGVVVVVHDATTDRTTNGRAPIRALTLDALRRFDAGHAFTMDGGRTFPYRGRGHDPLMARRALETVHRAGAAGRTLLASFDAGVLQEVRRLDATIATGLAQAEVQGFYAAYWAGRCVPGRPPRETGARLRKTGRLPAAARALQVPPRWRGLRLVSDGSVAAAHAAGLAVHVWTVDDPLDMRRLLENGVDGIVTNRPGLARETVDGFLGAGRSA
jgi:glycerophosphoryl diester phosphodiesterase